MKKWIVPLLSLFFVVTFALGLISGSFSFSDKWRYKEVKGNEYRVIPVQDEKAGETDPHMLSLLKEIQKKLDEWLKAINERIENQDVTRFEVRFLEILRNILEWIKEKVDAKVEQGEREKPKGKREKGLMRQIQLRNRPFPQTT